MAELVTQSGKVANPALTNLDILDSADIVSIANSTSAATAVFDTLDSLPTSGLSAGQQAFVNGNNRLYISNGTGWYNLTFVNRTPTWLTEPDASYTISDSATPLLVTAKATDSDNSDINLLNQSVATDSAQYMVNISTDSSVWTFTPKSADSIGIEVAAGNLTDSNGDFIYTFKWSDGINFVTKAVTINYSPSAFTGVDWNGSRGVSVGGETNDYLNNIDYFSITTLGDAQDFGDLSTEKSKLVVMSSAQRGVVAGGHGASTNQGGPGYFITAMEYFSFGTPSNTTSFGNLIVGSHDAMGGSNGTRGIYAGGDGSTGTTPLSTIQYITIDTPSNSTQFGNMTSNTHMSSTTSDDTYLGFLQGYKEINGGFAYVDGNTWITMDTTGNSTDTGELYPFGHGNGGKGVCSDRTYGVVFGGNQGSPGSSWNNEIRYLTIATKSDGSDFGDVINPALAHNGQTSHAQTKRGLAVGGFYNPGTVEVDTIQYITIDTPGNAQDFGDLTDAKDYGYGASGNAA